MSTFTFRELTLLDAERQLVGRCITDRAAVQASLEVLPLDCWRSEQGQDLARIFYALAGRLARGAYDSETNEDDLAVGLAIFDTSRDLEDWTHYLDGLWCPWTAVPEYLAGIVSALVDAYALHDGAVQAFRAYLEANPLTVSSDMEDDIYHRLRDVVVRRREMRFRKNVPEAVASPPPSQPPSKHQRGTLDAFAR